MDRILTHKKQISVILIMTIALALVPFSPSALAASNTFIDVSAGDSHTLAVMTGGSLWACVQFI
jgi:alpha-tubulin suppressor-like RCC1 family protein